MNNIKISNVDLQDIDLNNNSKSQEIDLFNNETQDIDLSNTSEPQNIDLRNNETQNINIANSKNITTIEGSNNYEELKNKPSINGVELTGNKTTEELGIQASGGTDINIKDTFEYLKKFQNNDIYNANAVNSSVDWIIQAILEAFNREVFIDINVQINPMTYQIISIDKSFSDIVNAFELGGTTRVVAQLAGTSTKIVLQLALLDSNVASFTTVMKANLGQGEMKYLLGINIAQRYQNVVIDVLS